MSKENNFGSSEAAKNGGSHKEEHYPPRRREGETDEEKSLSELLKEKDLVVVNIFASWCGPCELEFPEMEKVYQASREDIATYIREILDEVELERRDILLLAVKIFSETRLDFVDCILIAYHQIDDSSIFTFDKKLSRHLQ